MFDKSYVKKAGQMWKLGVGFIVLLISSLLFLVGLNLATKGYSDSFVIIALSGSVLGLSSFAWMVLSVKCPKCNAKLLWMQVANQSIDNKGSWLFSLEKCPVCGAEGTKEVL